MLASSYEFWVENATAQPIAASGVTINITPWKFGTDGALVYGTPVALTNAGTIADDASGQIGATQDNSSDLYLGAHLDCQFDALVGATGTATLYMRILGADQNTMALVSVTDITAQKIFGAEI